MGLFGGVIPDSFGIVIRDDLPQCARGLEVNDPVDPSKSIDLCDAVRLGHQYAAMKMDGVTARKYYNISLSVPGNGAAAVVDCSGVHSFNPVVFPSELVMNVIRGVRAFLTGNGIFTPLLYSGCRRVPAYKFRLTAASQSDALLCADELPQPANFPRDSWPLGLSNVSLGLGAGFTPDFCQSEWSVFQLFADGALRYQTQIVGLTYFQGEQFATLTPSTTHRFELFGGKLMLKGAIGQCIAADKKGVLKLDTCYQDSGFTVIPVL